MSEHVFEDVETMSDDALVAAVGSAAGRVAREMCRFLLLAAEVQRRELWAGWGMRSAASWLSWRCSVDLVTAREQLRVGKALTALPAIRSAFEAGRLSYSKVRAVTRVATLQDEQSWVEAAVDVPASRVVELVRGYRKATEPALAPEPGVRWRWDDDGMLVVSARLTPQQGAMLLAALEQAQCALDEAVVASAEATALPAPTGADALELVAQTALTAGQQPGSAGVEHAVVVHVAADRVHLRDGPGLPDPVARGLACDAVISAVVHGNEGQVLGVGRRMRTVGPLLRRAVLARDEGRCRYPGCRAARWLHVHHATHWADGGATDPDNLLALCSWHHRTLHDGCFTVLPQGDERFEFRRPEGTPIVVPPPKALGDPLPDPDPELIAGTWDGRRLDLPWAVAVLSEARGAA